MEVNNFMVNYFNFLPSDCKQNIFKKVNFSTEKKYKNNDKIKIDSNNVILYGNPIWDKKKMDWIYQCNYELEKKCCECGRLIVDKNKLMFYPQEEICYENMNIKYYECKDCHQPLCPICYFKESGSWRGMCNTCIWFDLG